MYNGFYNFKENPFSLSPDPAYLYMTVQHREALAGLIHGVCNRPGLTVLLGEAGTGKTTLLNVLVAWLEARRYVPAICTNPTLTREELYDILLTQMRVDCSSSLKSRQLAALQQTLQRYRSEGRPAIFIIDEAQRLPPELLEEIRLLMNLETPREKLLEIILSGQPELEQILRCTNLRQLKQRVGSICKLRTLTIDEVREYLNHRIEHTGVPNQTIFPEETIKAVHHLTDGIPRLINSLCNTALQIGFALECHRLTTAIVYEAASDLDLIRDAGGQGATELPTNEVADPAPSIRPVHNDKSTVGKNGDHTRVQDATNGQKHLTFLAGFLDRWR